MTGAPRRGGRSWRLRVAGRDLTTDFLCSELEPFAVPSPAPSGWGEEESGSLPRAGGSPRLLYRGAGWVGGRWQEVECHLQDGTYRLRVAGAVTLAVGRDGGSIRRLGDEVPADPYLLGAAAAGPALILALALQGVFCLHASAVSDGEGVVALMGASGAGKSTLAHRLDASGDPWHRLADDALAVEAEAGPARAWLHFPQLKLGCGEGAAPGSPEALPLAAVCLLSPPPPGAATGAGVTLQRLSPRAATLAMVRHTLAARLFDADVQGRHLGSCGSVAEGVGVYELGVPWYGDATARVARALGELIRTAPP